jgi:hypothetical protein
MNRLWLVLGAVIVLAGGIVLYLAIRDDGAAAKSSASPSARDQAPPSVRSPDGVRVPAGDPGGVTVRDVPSDTSNPREYYVDGKRVRDHRRNPTSRVEATKPTEQIPGVPRRISPKITQAFSTQLQAAMKECAQALPAEARGAKPRMEGSIVLAIKDQQARSTEAKLELRDVTGASVDGVRACIEQKAVGMQTIATDETDLERYSITLSLSF